MSDNNIPVSVMNNKIMEAFNEGSDSAIQKTAQAATGFTRIQVREDSFTYQILPPEKATDDILNISLDNDMPSVIWEIEPDSPGAKWVPLQSIPEGEYIQGRRYLIPMARIVTPKFTKDIDELRTYRMDLRKVLTDNAIKDGLAEIDGKWIETCDGIVIDVMWLNTDTGATTATVYDPDTDTYTVANPYGALGVAVQTLTGKVQYRRFSAGLDRSDIAEAKKMMPSGSLFPGFQDKFRLRNYLMLMNDVTAQDFLKYRREDAGGDLSQDLFENGLTLEKIMGMKTIYTIKGGIVPDGVVYFFAAPEFLGKFFYLTDWTMYMKKEAYFIECFAYWLGGFAIGNVAAVCRADFVD
jgi:hypothetical protein